MTTLSKTQKIKKKEAELAALSRELKTLKKSNGIPEKIRKELIKETRLLNKKHHISIDFPDYGIVVTVPVMWREGNDLDIDAYSVYNIVATNPISEKWIDLLDMDFVENIGLFKAVKSNEKFKELNKRVKDLCKRISQLEKQYNFDWETEILDLVKKKSK